MPDILRAAKQSTYIFFSLSAIPLFIPRASVLGLIVIMIPLGYLENLGISGLGHESNGFFIPTTFGFVLGAIIIWLGIFLMNLSGGFLLEIFSAMMQG